MSQTMPFAVQCTLQSFLTFILLHFSDFEIHVIKNSTTVLSTIFWNITVDYKFIIFKFLRKNQLFLNVQLIIIYHFVHNIYLVYCSFNIITKINLPEHIKPIFKLQTESFAGNCKMKLKWHVELKITLDFTRQ